jgi:hypothetical protein
MRQLAHVRIPRVARLVGIEVKLVNGGVDERIREPKVVEYLSLLVKIVSLGPSVLSLAGPRLKGRLVLNQVQVRIENRVKGDLPKRTLGVSFPPNLLRALLHAFSEHS